MPVNAAMFLFLAAAVVAVFAFLSIAVWVSVPAQERQARERMELLKTLALQPGENAVRVLEMVREEDRKREEKRRQEQRRGYIVSGLILIAIGIGIGTLLWLTKAGAEWAIGFMFIMMGSVLVGSGLLTKVERG
ncbi:MAG: hypothetical protein ACK5AZ_05120 [Bryobacteraceae bacterium]